ncbi:hypothetical protein WA158_001493 [Blastocystis sp. Blastoise]
MSQKYYVSTVQSIKHFDYQATHYIQVLHFERFLEGLVLIPGILFGRHCFPYVIIAVFILCGQSIGLHMTISSVLTVALTEILKYVFRRDRPHVDAVNNKLIHMRQYLNNPAFPSGDSAQAAVFSGVFLYHTHNLLFLLLPLPTMFSRVYYGAHWVGDTLAGDFIGLFISIYVSTLLNNLTKSLVHIDMLE